MSQSTIIATVTIVAGLAALTAFAIYDGSKRQRVNTSEEQQAEAARAQRHGESMEQWYKENPGWLSKNAPDLRRLFLENHAGDDGAREIFLSSVLKNRGERCDKVESLLKDTVGQADGAIWRMKCAPGYEYTFLFGPDGKPTHLRAE